MKLHCLYLGKYSDGTPSPKLPIDTVECIRSKMSDGKYHLIPTHYVGWGKPTDEVTEAFVPGHGWKNIKKTKRYIVPVYDGEIEHFNEYRSKYGDFVLSYCLNGNDFFTGMDCCEIEHRNEYIALCYYGAEVVSTYNEHWDNLMTNQRKVFYEKYRPIFVENGYGKNFDGDLYMFYPWYCFYGVPFLSADTVNDDKKMEELYRYIRTHELFTEHKDYVEFKKLRDKCETLRNGRGYCYMEGNLKWESIVDKYNEIETHINKDILSQIDDEIEKGTDNFPVCMSDRMRIMYGEEVNKEYSFILDYTEKIRGKNRKSA